MSKSQIVSLILIALTVIVLLLTKGKADVPMIFWTIKNATASFVYLGFVVVGVAIGVLLK